MLIALIAASSVFAIGLLTLFIGTLHPEKHAGERMQLSSIVFILPAIIGFIILGVVQINSGPSKAEQCSAENKIFVSENRKDSPRADICVTEEQYEIIFPS